MYFSLLVKFSFKDIIHTLLIYLFFDQPEEELVPEPAPVEVQPSEPRPAASPSPEETEETWEEKEDKLDTENIEPETAKPVEQKYQYKEGERGNGMFSAVACLVLMP